MSLEVIVNIYYLQKIRNAVAFVLHRENGKRARGKKFVC